MTISPDTTLPDEDDYALRTTHYESFIPFIKAVGRGEKLKRDLTLAESVAAMRLIAKRGATDAQIGAFLIAQRVKGEAVDEILGFTQVLREEFMVQIQPQVEGLLDLAVPYDGKAKTAQLAPAVAVVLAEAGVPVVLHGADDVPTKSGVGPGPVLAALGVGTLLPPQKVQRMIETVGFGYLHASQFGPAYNALTPLRHQFGLRTVLNTVEKFLNPANAPYQVSGFFHANYIERIRTAQTGTKASWMVQGEEGSIEMAAGRRTQIYARESAHDLVLDPAEVGLPQRERIELPPDVGQHAALVTAVLQGTSSPAADQTAFTSGTIMYLLGAAANPAEGFQKAHHILQSGAAASRLAKIQNYG